MSHDREPSPPSQHKKWKRAQQRPNGNYTSDASRLVPKKIDSLVNSTREGSFIPKSRHDILVEAIRTKEYGGCVHGVGDCIDLRVCFGTSRKSTGQVQKEKFEEFDRKIDK
ncbi:unnamed protein product [Lathyrus oleraceus]